jgi:hypothetical protein
MRPEMAFNILNRKIQLDQARSVLDQPKAQ